MSLPAFPKAATLPKPQMPVTMDRKIMGPMKVFSRFIYESDRKCRT